MSLYVIDTVSQEQTDFVREYLEKNTDFDLGSDPTERYIGFSDTNGIKACHSDEPPSNWRGYKKISVDELFEYLSQKEFEIYGLKMNLTESGEIKIETSNYSSIFLSRKALEQMIKIIDNNK